MEFITKLFSEGNRKMTIALLILVLIYVAFIAGKLDQTVFTDVVKWVIGLFFGANAVSNVFSKPYNG